MSSNSRIKLNKGDIHCVVAYGYPDAQGNIVERKGIEDLAAYLIEQQYPIVVHYIDKSDDGSQGLAVLIASFDEEKTRRKQC